MYCPAKQKIITASECSGFILQTDRRGIERCRACEQGQKLMASVVLPRQALSIPTIKQKEKVMTKKKIYTAGDIAALAGVTTQQVYSAKSRAKHGAVPSFGISKTIADVMAKHGITWDMLGKANYCRPMEKTAPVAKGKAVAKAPASVEKGTAVAKSLGSEAAEKPVVEASGSVIKGKIVAKASSPVASVAKIITPAPVAKPVTEEALTAISATNNSEEPRVPSAPEKNTTQKETALQKEPSVQNEPATLDLRSIGTGQLVREIKRRFPTATLSITL